MANESSRIDREWVQYVAHLSRIAVSEAELERFQAQLDKILVYMDKLNELDTSEVEPMSAVMGLKNVFREDATRPPLSVGDALANAPARTEDSFRMPPIIEVEEDDVDAE